MPNLTPHTHVGSLDIDRWKVGHRVFFAQVQTLILSLKKFQLNPSAEGLTDIADMLLGSAVMMQYSAKFPSGKYDTVRDDMAHLDERFSGTFSGDHAVMLKEFRVVAELGQQFPKAHDYFRQALETVYKAHAFVCKVVAGDSGSLANKDIIAWEYVATRLLSKALRKAGINDSQMPTKFGLV